VPYIYVTGGASSGKSGYSLKFFQNRKDVIFIATGIATDPEMRERIRVHRELRPRFWDTIEEPFDLIAAVNNASPEKRGIIIDCLTFWVTNLIFQKTMNNDEILGIARSTAEFLRLKDLCAVVITNELGMGIVPSFEDGRRFRKIAGEVNQIFAEKSEEAYLIVSGIPLKLK
jgi:adenosylcobinamide kinase/adenosylcobinamide-phosphate guanylyltransferase